MGTKMFIACGQNVLLERLKENNDTFMGKVLSCVDGSFNFGDIVLYKNHDVDKITIHKGLVCDLIWSQKIRCKMIQKPEKSNV